MSKLNLWQINNLYIGKDTSPERPQTFRACIFTERVYTKIRPGHLAVSGALKTIFVFTAARSLQKQVLCSRRSKVSASRPYAPDTRGVCFQGPSRALWYLISRCGASHGTKHRPGSEISQNSFGKCCTSAHHLLGWMRFSASYRCIAQ